MTALGWKLIFVSFAVSAFLGLILHLAGLPLLRSSFVVFNLAATAGFGIDKYFAVQSRQRIPEAALLILAAAGASPGILLGQLLFRHKARNTGFQAFFLTIVVVQAFLLMMIM